MKIEIDFNKKEIVLLEPASLKDLNSRLGGLGVSDFKIVSKEPDTVLTTGYNHVVDEPIDYGKLNSTTFPEITNDYYYFYAGDSRIKISIK